MVAGCVIKEGSLFKNIGNSNVCLYANRDDSLEKEKSGKRKQERIESRLHMEGFAFDRSKGTAFISMR